MELRQLRYFIAVVEAGAVSRAAEILHIVQPAVSQQLAHLEAELGTKLLIRSSKGAVPNEAGRALYEHAKFILRQCDSAKAVLQSSGKLVNGPVSIGLAPTTAAMLGSELLLAFRKRYPDIIVTLVEAMSGHLDGMLLSHTLDVAILFNERLPAQVDCESLLTERLFLIRRGARSLPAGRVTLRQASAHALILPSRAHGLRKQLDLAFAHLRLFPQVVAEIDSLALVMEAVQLGIGATIQPWAALGRCAGTPRGLQVEEISDPHVVRSNYLCLASKLHATPAAFAARDLVREVARGLVEGGRWKGTTLASGVASREAPDQVL